MSEPATAKHHDLEATIAALKAGEVIGRRNFEAYKAWAKLERDWLNAEELEHLKRAMGFAKQHNRSLRYGFERTRAEIELTMSKPEPGRLAEMARELTALRVVSEDSRKHQEALIARLKTEDAYYAAWETRLRRSEEEVLALWNIIDELIALSSVSAPRLEKLEKRVGYQQRQGGEEVRRNKLTHKPVGH
jgi:hypothetical protein